MEYYVANTFSCRSSFPDFERTIIDRYESLIIASIDFRFLFFPAFLETYSAPYAARIRVTMYISRGKKFSNSNYKI